VKRELTIAVAGAAILAAGITGCSSNKSSTGGGGTTGGSPSVATPGGNASKVLIDGKDQNVQGTTVCTTANGTVNIAIGGAATGIGAVLSDGNPPDVKSVALGNVNGVSLGYAPGGQGNASATKDGNKYTIKGTATGVDMANPMQPVNKPFEIDANCSS
jgi:ipoprotein LpqH